MSNAYKFSDGPRVPETAPETPITKLLDRAFSDTPLTEQEADDIAMRLYGVGSNYGAQYKIAGWCWPMYNAKQMRRILVSIRHDEGVFRTFYAPNKKALRKALKSCGYKVVEMLTVKQKQSV